MDYSDRAVLRRFLKYITKFKYWIVLSIILMSITNSYQVYFVYSIEQIINNIGAADIEETNQNFILIVLTMGFLGAMFTSTIGTYVLTHVGQLIIAQLRQESYHSVVNIPYSKYEALSTSQLVNRILVQINAIASHSTSAMTSLSQDIVLVIALVAMMIYQSPELSVVTLAMFAMLYFLFHATRSYFNYLATVNIEVYDGMTRMIVDTLKNFQLIRLYANNSVFPNQKKFEKANSKIVTVISRTATIRNVFQMVVQFSVLGTLLLIIYVASNGYLSDEFTAGTFVSFMFSFLLIAQPIRRLALTVVSDLRQGIATCREIFIIQDWEQVDGAGLVDFELKSGKIEYKNVSYTYPGKTDRTLEDVSFTIKANSKTAIIGSSGSGKSTVVKLLLKMYQPDQGQIFIDGADIATVSGRSLRSSISMMSQEPIICNGTVSENIAYGELAHHSMDEIREAARAAYALDFIERLPEKFDTLIGSETTAMLSGGQCQRIALARVFLKNSKILVFDEPTSALDPESEELIYRAIEDLRKDRTIIIIAHREATLRSSEHVIYLKAGKIKYSTSIEEAQDIFDLHFSNAL